MIRTISAVVSGGLIGWIEGDGDGVSTANAVGGDWGWHCIAKTISWCIEYSIVYWKTISCLSDTRPGELCAEAFGVPWK